MPVKSKGKISQNLVAFSEYMNFKDATTETIKHLEFAFSKFYADIWTDVEFKYVVSSHYQPLRPGKPKV